jgi:hypothetical protein
VEKSFGSLDAQLKSTIGQSLAALSATRQNLNATSAVQAAIKEQGRIAQHLKAISAVQTAMEEQARIEQRLKGSSTVQAAMEELARNQKLLGLGVAGYATHNEDRTNITPKISPIAPANAAIAPITIPSYEESAPGRAATRVAEASEETARQVREVAGVIGQMAGQMEGLQTTFLTEVLPQWYKNLEDSASSTRKSINVAIGTAIVSVIVAFAVTRWQVSVGDKYQAENDKGQKSAELLMQKQLEATQLLNKQLADDSKHLREEVDDLRKAVERKNSKNTTIAKKPNGSSTSR